MIDPKKEDRAFFFTIFIDGSKYVMKECEPPLPASQVDALIDEVNITNDFSKFVRAMRRKFKESL